MTTRPTLPSRGMLFYFLLCTLSMIWPGALIANRIEPMVMGLPFFVFWYIAWVFAMFVGLVICYRRESAKEVDDE
ncbi:hypothetical protein [Halomonas faecis]|uniref:hypothetical protein n=1 Tax=Halomonas faecis TaxID=1562110 RepID=UPI0013D61627|nr:hypothetical protein [Halomonas faecis]